MPETAEKKPSERIKEFLDFVRECSSGYQLAYDMVNQEDRKLQDFVHQVEFASDEEELHRAAVELQESRRVRRRNKDEVQLYEALVKFFEGKGPKDTLNRLEQLLGQQLKTEEYLAGGRTYRPRTGK